MALANNLNLLHVVKQQNTEMKLQLLQLCQLAVCIITSNAQRLLVVVVKIVQNNDENGKLLRKAND